jgi:DNA invertase Pin-like site-specific DNA recombinase
MRERIKAGIKQRQANGLPVGRPRKEWKITVEQIAGARERGVSWRQMEKDFSIPAVTLRNLYSAAFSEANGHASSTLSSMR